MSASVASDRDATRLAWPDATRGLGVVAVVLFHVLIWHHAAINGGVTALGGLWEQADIALGRLRMPVLFALSGVLAARGVLKGWAGGSVVLRGITNYYLYAVWLTIYLVFFLIHGDQAFPHALLSVSDWASQLIVPATTLWFIFALALYPALLAALRAARIPTYGVVGLALLLWAFGTYSDLPGFTGKIAENFLFFSLGMYTSDPLRRMARAGRGVKVALVISFLALVGLTTVVTQALVVPVVLISSIIAIPAVVGVVAAACHLTPIARAGHYVGGRTLPIYLLHPLVLAVLAFLPDDPIVGRLVTSALGDALYPITLTVVVIAVSIGVHSLLRMIPGDPLFGLPPVVRQRVARGSGSQSL